MKYFQGKISPGFVAVFSGRMVLRVAGGLLGLFLPVFLYEIFNLKIQYVFYYFLSIHLLYGLLIAWGAQYLNKIGLRRSLRLSVIVEALFYFSLYLLDKYFGGEKSSGLDLLLFLLVLSIVFQLIRKIMYWLPLHTDMAKFTDRSNRGKELGVVYSSTVVIQAVLPISAGWIIFKFGYDYLFILAVVVCLCSLIPFSFLPRTQEKFSWSYWETWKEFFSRKRRRQVLAYAGNGAEDLVGVLIWPIFIWEILHGNYFEVGAISSLIVAVTVVFQLTVGRLSDSLDKNKMITVGNFFYATGWIFKIFIATAFQIFLASTYHSLTKIFSRTPFDTLTYEKAADQGHFVDEFTVIHEMAFNAGKVLMILFSLLLISLTGIKWTFILAALASLFMNFLVDHQTVGKGRHVG